MKPTTFVGLDNYTRALGDPLFWRSLSSTLGYTVVTVAGQLLLGLGAALLLNQRIPGRSVLRLVYYLPVITSWVIVSLVFLYLYNGQAGALNWLLQRRPGHHRQGRRVAGRAVDRPVGHRRPRDLEGHRLDDGRVPRRAPVRAR